MSTRSIILVTGKPLYNSTHATTRLYKHSDGYPTGNLPIILEALKRSQAQHVESEALFKESPRERKMVVDQVVGNVIGAATDVYGMGARIDTDGDREEKMACFQEPLKAEHFGNQDDLEWIYVIDIEAKEVRILSGSCTGKEAKAFKTQKMLADPLAYADYLRDECKSSELKKTVKLIKDIEATGFKVVRKVAQAAKAPSKKSAPKLALLKK